jgi:hypothetical protein
MNNVKVVLIAACVCAGASQARADARSDVLAGIQRCGVIRDDRVWLDCVYGANQPMRAQLGLAPAAEFQQRLVPQVQFGAPQQQMDLAPASTRPVPRANKKPGFFSTMLGIAPPVAVSRMAACRYDDHGAFVVTLENGQEWRQTDVQGNKVIWVKKPSAYMVTIANAAFGTYSLHTDENPQAYKVERLK